MCEVHVCLAPVDTNHLCKLSPATLKTPAFSLTCGEQEEDASSAHKSRGQGARGYPVSCCSIPHPYQKRSTALGGHSDGPLPRLAILKTPSQLTIYSAHRKINATFCWTLFCLGYVVVIDGSMQISYIWQITINKDLRKQCCKSHWRITLRVTKYSNTHGETYIAAFYTCIQGYWYRKNGYTPPTFTSSTFFVED